MMNTWSGQPESAAWHWTDENRKKLGNVIYLLKSGGAKGREQAYQGFIELKRNFIEEEFDEYLNRLDDLRDSMGEPPLRKIMDEIRGERAPVTGWVAKEGAPVNPVMLPEMEKGPWNVLVHQESGCAWISDTVYAGDGLVEPHLMDASLNECMRMIKEYELRGYSVTYEPEVHKKPVTRYDLLIKILKGGYYALEM